MSRSLQMVFQNQAGKNVSINVPEIKENLTETEVRSLMELIISKNIFDTAGGSLVGIMTANVVSRDSEELKVR